MSVFSISLHHCTFDNTNSVCIYIYIHTHV
uniref:Uncharacterized protein n=1 Tax=Anguilla anguilla TaxID=7936 RepID=A0A0E9Q5F8_ANGAN